VVFTLLPWVAQSSACRGCPDQHVTTQVRLHTQAHTSGAYPPQLWSPHHKLVYGGAQRSADVVAAFEAAVVTDAHYAVVVGQYRTRCCALLVSQDNVGPDARYTCGACQKWPESLRRDLHRRASLEACKDRKVGDAVELGGSHGSDPGTAEDCVDNQDKAAPVPASDDGAPTAASTAAQAGLNLQHRARADEGGEAGSNTSRAMPPEAMATEPDGRDRGGIIYGASADKRVRIGDAGVPRSVTVLVNSDCEDASAAGCAFLAFSPGRVSKKRPLSCSGGGGSSDGGSSGATQAGGRALALATPGRSALPDGAVAALDSCRH
jgi:hypothetical protein